MTVISSLVSSPAARRPPPAAFAYGHRPRLLMRPARVVAVGLLVALASACATVQQPHVTLDDAPTKDAPFEERAAYYKSKSADSLEADHMFLHDGTRVYWPEDLRPAIDQGSPTDKAIEENLAAREEIEAFAPVAWGAYGGTVAGAALMDVALLGLGGALALVVLPPSVGLPDQAVTYTLIGSGVIGCGGLALLTMAIGAQLAVDTLWLNDPKRRAAESGERAARTYNQALTDRLGVGVNANGVIFDLKTGSEQPAEPQVEPKKDAQEI